ncbi:condensin complex subunit 2 [Megachile rotundata]|uniref:condensin complex subunit 2 n=1 Tax=Megachile rotundata TaxID=143995 RepID=UPI003FD1F5F0
MDTLQNKENILLATHSTSLRRKSVLAPNLSSSVLIENNDEAERLALHHELQSSAKSTNVNNKRMSLGLDFVSKMSAPDVKQHITDCIKLNTENKINAKNAFSLEIIDFMTYMISKKDDNMTNLQVASTSLDVSTKIYGFRVDNVHTEIMKMSGGLDKHEDENQINDLEGQTNSEQGNNDPSSLSKKKKKKNKQKIFATMESLKGPIEISKPSLWIREEQDAQSTNALYQVMLPNHANSNFYLHSYNDVIVDTIEHKTNDTSTKVTPPRIEGLTELEVCPPLINFEFRKWTGNEEEELSQGEQSEENNDNRFQFDLDASIPSEEEVVHNDLNYSNIENEEENVNKCVEIRKLETNIVDLCKVVSNCPVTKTSEYSFIQKSMNKHWAGPSHWKINNLRNFSGQSKIIETCQQRQTRKRKEIEMNYDDKTKKAIEVKFVLGRNSKMEAARLEWLEEDLTLPWDMHYDIAYTTKLYLHKMIELKVQERDNLNATHISDIEDYDYNNENDTSNYCPRVPNDDYEACEDNTDENECNFASEAQRETQAFTDNNLVTAPKLTNKIFIAYSVQAKRIDMRQLKRSIWKSLTLKTDNSAVEDVNTQNTTEREENEMNNSKCFSNIYKTLPNMLTKTNMEALSFPISFVSLLHLANEKTLRIQSLPDMSDIIVETDNVSVT